MVHALFSYITTSTKDGYPFVGVAGDKLDNRWVVPYNRYLCLKYNDHIHLEIRCTVSAFNYTGQQIFCYLTKLLCSRLT